MNRTVLAMLALIALSGYTARGFCNDEHAADIQCR